MPQSVSDAEKAVPTGTPTAPPIATTVSQRPRDALNKTETLGSDIFDSIPLWRKSLVVFATSWTTLAACFSSTSLLSASTEIAADLHSTPEVVSLSTAGLLFAIGLSALVWSPIAAVSLFLTETPSLRKILTPSCQDCGKKVGVQCLCWCAIRLDSWRCCRAKYARIRHYARLVWLAGLLFPCRGSDNHCRVLSSCMYPLHLSVPRMKVSDILS